MANKILKLAQDRTAFIEFLHDVFIKKTGHGAFAYISISDAISLFDEYSLSSEPVDRFINDFVRSI